MKVYVWRHNKTYHSHSMINEPCILNEFYLDAIAIVAAKSLEGAWQKLSEQNKGWQIEDLKKMEPSIYELEDEEIIFTEIRGKIEHL